MSPTEQTNYTERIRKNSYNIFSKIYKNLF